MGSGFSFLKKDPMVNLINVLFQRAKVLPFF